MNNDISTVKNTGMGRVHTNPAHRATISEPAVEPQSPLPKDIPHSPSDAIALTPQARTLTQNGTVETIGALGPPDHDVRTAPVGPRRLEVDSSGSYHLG